MSNSNGSLSVYAWLYNAYNDYLAAEKIPLYKHIVRQRFETLDQSTQNDLKDIIQWEKFYFDITVMGSKKEAKFNQHQYSFVSVLHRIIQEDSDLSIEHWTRWHYVWWWTTKEAVEPISVLGHGWPDNRDPDQ